MKKSIYSLALSDNVIKAVDAEAYKQGISRSAMINQILAEKLSCDTPETRMDDISGALESILGDILQIERQRSASLLILKSVLEYKYRPTLSYKLELDRVPTQYIGTLKVQLRTQSERLAELFNEFFMYRISFECGVFAKFGAEEPECRLFPCRFERRFFKPRMSLINDDGQAIGEYINDLNRAIRAFLADPTGFPSAAPDLEKIFVQIFRVYGV